MTEPITNTRCGFVALLGAPNAGKSTLVNRMVGAKVAIVSPKVQTTRSRVTGILVEGTAQAVFLDLPGVFAPKRRHDRAMVAAAWRVLGGPHA
jgi:GTP-binding protein Era